MRILVGTDGSPGATVAVRWAAHLAVGLGAEVVLASAFELEPFDLDGHLVDSPEGVAEAVAGRWADPLAAAGVPFETVVLVGPAADALREHAEDHDIDLVVVGSRGRGGFAGLMLGSVADHLAHHTDRPLAVVPGEADPRLPVRIVLGSDASQGAEAATAWLAPVAAELRVPVTAVHVSMLEPDAFPETDPRNPAVMLRGPWTAALAEWGVKADVEQRTSEHVAPALAEVAHDLDASVIVIGTRMGHQPLHPRIGGVTMQLVHRATDLVIVVVPPV